MDGWMDGWFEFNVILSTQVATISCLRLIVIKRCIVDTQTVLARMYCIDTVAYNHNRLVRTCAMPRPQLITQL